MFKKCFFFKFVKRCNCVVKSELFSKLQVLDSSKLKKFADDNFKFDNGGKSSKRVENTVGKGDIARYKQYLLFTTVFSKDFG